MSSNVSENEIKGLFHSFNLFTVWWNYRCEFDEWNGNQIYYILGVSKIYYKIGFIILRISWHFSFLVSLPSVKQIP